MVIEGSWQGTWRTDLWQRLGEAWDLIIIGGGITGAGILREATRAGLKALLVEADDFASGTSSRSSKLVHGGFRYLKNAQIKLTWESVRERERLLKDGRGLVTTLGFLMPNYIDDRIPAWVLGMGLTIYDLLAFKWGHRYYASQDIRELCPQLNTENLRGGYRFFDAQTDDARLVLRVIKEAVQQGGTALNYAEVQKLLVNNSREVCGIALVDRSGESSRTVEVLAPVVINATGAWADRLRLQAGGRPRLRLLRGSHLFFPRALFPLNRALSIWHPCDGRPVYAFSWEGVTIVGTTDVDHEHELETDITISKEEADYLLEAVTTTFPCLNLDLSQVQSTIAGVRGVVDTGKKDPSKESREHILWNENGLLTVTGGKLTTFRLMAHDALEVVRRRLPGNPRFDPRLPVLNPTPMEILADLPLERSLKLRLLGRYGEEAAQLLANATSKEYEQVSETPTLWAELRWCAHAEAALHLDDLLLRRVRLGLVLPRGGIPWLDQIRRVVQPEFGWDDERWKQEVDDYTQLWERFYSPDRLN